MRQYPSRKALKSLNVKIIETDFKEKWEKEVIKKLKQDLK